jgi:hypothetical protein
MGKGSAFCLQFCLAPAPGAVDIIGYLQFDRVFVANMTGNTVFFASDLVSLQFPKALYHLLPIVTFLAGVVTTRIALIRHDQPAWPKIGVCLILISGLWAPGCRFDLDRLRGGSRRWCIGRAPLRRAFTPPACRCALFGRSPDFCDSLPNLVRRCRLRGIIGQSPE